MTAKKMQYDIMVDTKYNATAKAGISMPSSSLAECSAIKMKLYQKIAALSENECAEILDHLVAELSTQGPKHLLKT